MEVDSDPRLDILKPYNAYDLQQEFEDDSPLEAYTRLCAQHECKPNSHVSRLLSNTANGWDTLSVLDVSKTYIGPKGFISLINLCCRLSSLRRLCLADNFLQNESIWHLAGMAMHHPTLTEIDISQNEFISWTGGMCIAQALLGNVQITSIWLYQTAIPPSVAQGIFQQTRRNAVAMFVAQGGCRNPGDHAQLIKLRAIQRFFEAMQGEDRCIAKDALESGFKERLRIEGKDLTAYDYTADFMASLNEREPPERVSWDAFIVLVMLEGVKYSSTLVSALRKVFLEFDVCYLKAVDAIGVNGYVEVRSFADIYVRLYEQKPEEEDITYLQDLLGLTNGQTVDWSEFLYIWYHRRLQAGKRSVGSTLTPLSRTTFLWHY
ncbi:unnamed protein product [Phytomonas sp. EM1]|nr:unnamed protein product [Phytomonas sp. EM1]|eukprot:CCW59793.1 unnamed protein product [Phytomonas sp. isolate EM1]